MCAVRYTEGGPCAMGLHEPCQAGNLSLIHIWELLLVKIEADEKNRTEVREIAEIYKAKIIDLSRESMVMELTGEDVYKRQQ